jgi:hypothetical protein
MSTDQLAIPGKLEFNPLLPFPDGANVEDWMFDIVRPFTTGRSLEIESGNDSIVSCFLKNNLPIHLSNTDRENFEILTQKYEGNPLIRSIHRINLNRTDFYNAYTDRMGIFDTVLTLNNAKPEKLDSLILANANLLLKKGGHLILLIPAYTALYTGMEDDSRAIKRHNRLFVRTLFGPGFEVQQTQYFNHPIFGLSVIAIASKK